MYSMKFIYKNLFFLLVIILVACRKEPTIQEKLQGSFMTHREENQSSSSPYQSLKINSDALVQIQASKNELKVLGFTLPITSEDQMVFSGEKVDADGNTTTIKVNYINGYDNLTIVCHKECGSSDCFHYIHYQGRKQTLSRSPLSVPSSHDFSVIYREHGLVQGQWITTVDTNYTKNLLMEYKVPLLSTNQVELAAAEIQLDNHTIESRVGWSYIYLEKEDATTSYVSELHWGEEVLLITEIQRTYDPTVPGGVLTSSWWTYRKEIK